MLDQENLNLNSRHQSQNRNAYAVEEEEKVPFKDISNRVEHACNISYEIRDEETHQIRQKDTNLRSLKQGNKNNTKVLYAKKESIRFNKN